jgi:hypothetical protein
MIRKKAVCCLLTALFLLLANTPTTLGADGEYRKPASPPHAPPIEYEPKTRKYRAECLAMFGIGVHELLTSARIHKEFRHLSRHYHPDRVGHTAYNLEYYQNITTMRDDLVQEVELGMQYITDRAVYRNGQYHFQRAEAGAGGGGFTSARARQDTAGASGGAAGAGGSAAGAGGRNHNPHDWFEQYSAQAAAEILREAQAAAEKAAAQKAAAEKADAQEAEERAKAKVAEEAKRFEEFWQEQVAWEEQRVENLKSKKKRWASFWEQEQERLAIKEDAERRAAIHDNATAAAQSFVDAVWEERKRQEDSEKEELQAIVEEIERRASIHLNATKAALALLKGFYWSRFAQEEKDYEASEKNKHWKWWLKEILQAGFDVFDFCDASFAPLTEEAMERKCSRKAGRRGGSHSPIVISDTEQDQTQNAQQHQHVPDTSAQDPQQHQHAPDTSAQDPQQYQHAPDTSAQDTEQGPAQDTSAGMNMRDSDDESCDVSTRGRKRMKTDRYRPQ